MLNAIRLLLHQDICDRIGFMGAALRNGACCREKKICTIGSRVAGQSCLHAWLPQFSCLAPALVMQQRQGGLQARQQVRPHPLRAEAHATVMCAMWYAICDRSAFLPAWQLHGLAQLYPYLPLCYLQRT